MLHGRGKKGAVQQKREAHALGRAGSYSTEPSKVDKYKFTGRQISPKFCCLQVKVIHSVFSNTFAAGPLASARPSLLFLQCTYTHFSSPVCLLPSDPILHHPSTSTGPMQWCKTLGYHNDTNSTGFKTREA